MRRNGKHSPTRSPPTSPRSFANRITFPLLAEHLRKQEPGRPLTLWCSACSTGEEAYSMAMTAVEALGRLRAAVSHHRFRPGYQSAADGARRTLQGRCRGQIARAAGRALLSARYGRSVRLYAGEAGVAKDDRFPLHQPAGCGVADSCAAGCDLLPQCDDLFRQGDATCHPQEICAAVAQRRLVVCRAFGKFLSCQRHIQVARPYRIRTGQQRTRQ